VTLGDADFRKSPYQDDLIGSYQKQRHYLSPVPASYLCAFFERYFFFRAASNRTHDSGAKVVLKNLILPLSIIAS
jgi:hypothetical protein